MLSLSLVIWTKGKRSHRQGERRHLDIVFSVNHTMERTAAWQKSTVADVTGAQIHTVRSPNWKADRQRDNLIPLTSIQHSVYASQTEKNTMAGEERERQKINTSRDTHCLLSFLLTNTTTYTYKCDGTVHVEAYTQHEQQKHETVANNTKHRTWYLIPLYYGFKLQSSCRLPLICSRFVL